MVAYAQGFEQIAAAAEAYGWDVELGGLATIWRGGCIIRARFLDRIREAYAADPGLRNLLFAGYFRDAVGRRPGCLAAGRGHRGRPWAWPPRPSPRRWPTTTASGASAARPNLLQAQRDFFGAHTYRRTDRPGSFHTRWSEDGQEVEV